MLDRSNSTCSSGEFRPPVDRWRSGRQYAGAVLDLPGPRSALTFQVLEPEVSDDGSRIALRYRISGAAAGPVDFVEQITLPGDGAQDDPATRAPLVRLLALAAGLSYYKAVIPPRIEVAFGLTDAERDFLVEVVRNGLSEFAYRNEVPEALRPHIVADRIVADRVEGRAPAQAERVAQVEPTRALVAVGGGKDSIVTIESLRTLPLEITLFSVNEYAPIRATADHAGLPLVTATRRLDPALFALNDAGALNGHVPVTAVNSLIGGLTALRLGLDSVVFSNEASASAGNLHWEGVEVNHQWSKGIEFERLLRSHLTGSPLTYVSFLRPLTELAIMRRFATLRSYHPVFTSCNRAFHLDPSKRRLWCGDCPKCRFVFLTLAPFVAREELLAIFGGRDLLADPAQTEGFLDLLNADGRLKPFECVGEPSECRVALTLLSRSPEWADSPFLAVPSAAASLVPEGWIEAAFAFEERHFLTPMLEKAARAVL